MYEQIQQVRRMSRRRFERLTGFGVVLGAGLALGGCSLTDLLPADGTGDGDSATGGPTPTAASIAEGLLQVTSVDVVIRESFPPQISANVRGTLPDSCTEVGEISQSRAGNAITVTIATVRDPQALCAQALVPVELSVDLEGDWPSGDYTVTVNGVTATFRV
jgi:hypothetical protein